MIFWEVHYINYLQEKMAISDHEKRLLINESIEDEGFQAVKNSGNEAQVQFFLQNRWIKHIFTKTIKLFR